MTRPEVIAHRGASEERAEHTLEAYLAAIEAGADALEADVRLTRDGHLVCVHDRRVDRTSDGRGPVSALGLADLAELDFASWHRPRARSDVADGDEQAHAETAYGGILTLRRLCEVVRDCGREVGLAIETKHPTTYGGLVERRLVELLEEFGLTAPGAPLRVMSFSSVSLRRMRRLAPEVTTVHLLARVPRLPANRVGVLSPWVSAVGPSIRALRTSPDFVARSHERGRRVHVWTVDADDDVDLCVALDVDAIITNRPAAVLDRLRQVGD